ncbi:MAG: hypothetical protein ABJ360_24730 [Roseobacter sp.]
MMSRNAGPEMKAVAHQRRRIYAKPTSIVSDHGRLHSSLNNRTPVPDLKLNGVDPQPWLTSVLDALTPWRYSAQVA